MGDLEKFLNVQKAKNQLIELDRQCTWSRQLISAARHLETQKIIHRDIKPSNIFLMDDENKGLINLKLGDFGLARELKVFGIFV